MTVERIIVSAPRTLSDNRKLDKAGGEMAGSIFMSGNQIGGLAAGTGTFDAVNKDQLDTNPAIFTDLWATRRAVDPNNLFSPALATINKGLDGNNGTTFTATGYYVTGFLAVRVTTPVRCSVAIHTYAFYDSTGTFLSGYSGTDIAAGTAISVPGRAHFFQTDFAAADLGKVIVTQKATVPAIAQPFDARSPWHGKKIGWLGDSQLDRTSYNFFAQPAVCDELGAVDFPFTNDALSGRRWGDCLPGGAHPALTTGALDGVDMLVILLGANDWDGPDKAFGAYTDTASASTFAGDVRKVYERVRSINQAIHIVTLLPNKRGANPAVVPGLKSYKDTNTYGKTLEDYCNLIKQIAADYNSPTIDLFRELPFTDQTFSYYTGGGDWIHLDKATGQPMFARFLARRLRNI